MRALVRIAKRHKKKLIFSLVVFGGGYFTVKYGVNMLLDYVVSQGASQMASGEFLVMRKHKHYLTIKQTSDEAISELLNSLNEQIRASLPVEELLESLKKKPTVNKLEIWENLKLMSLSKVLVEIYAVSMLALFIKIELNIIGAHLFIQDSNNSNSSFASLLNMDVDDAGLEKQIIDSKASTALDDLNNQQSCVLTPDIQKQYLGNIENFVRIGLPNLINKMQLLCEQTFKPVNLKTDMSVDTLAEKFDLIRQKLESRDLDLTKAAVDANESITTIDLDKLDEIVAVPDGDDDQILNKSFCADDSVAKSGDKEEETYLFACKYLLPDVHQIATGQEMAVAVANGPKSEEETLASLNMETYDIISSADCRKTLSSLIELLIGEYFNHLTSVMVQQIMSADIDHSEKITISMPFAKMIPILNKLNMIESHHSNQLIDKLLDNACLNIFSANIYEAFSFDPSKAAPKPAAGESEASKLPNALKSLASADSLMTRLLF